eukprot:CAMPEP_0119296706 /NCGR_PEP_ID=MMETSP1329-20130426/50708_1 /TAXON_ID=114041 /ORGANISM="Genus nov. species nov., Strain RCC1024" /LENGTH=311 /DNA_ID=CAMNT_0007297643 /DNA_START=147 /DNA_END=1078 /DNA_ORIENTATION=+
MRLLLLVLIAAAEALLRPRMSFLRSREPPKVQAPAATREARAEGTVVAQLLSLEAERRELEAKLRANKERQRALALGEDVERRPPRVVPKAKLSDDGGCADATVWSEACDVDVETDLPAAAAAPAETLDEFLSGALSRGGWLVGLLAAQSLSSIVLEANEAVIQRHPVIVFFLTMLVGAGGNAGNQAAVRIIRGLAVGAVVPGENGASFVWREAKMALVLATALSGVGFYRVYSFSAGATTADAFAITLSLFIIVSISIVLGAALPIGLEKVGAGASNAATTIQVIMDVSGVLITCAICGYVLDGTPLLQA